MADRNQNYQSGRQRQDWRDEDYTRRGSYRSRDEDEGRYSGSSEDRDYGYGSYSGSDEGESSMRAGSYDQGRSQFGRSRDTGGQSGSTGRYAGYGDFGQGDYSGGRRGYSGQGNYGQTGYGQGGYGQGTYGQPSYGFERGQQYGRDYGSSGTSQYGRSEYRDSGYGGSRGGRYSQGTFGTERGGWNEPYGEGQQYTSRGEYAGSSMGGMGQHRGKGPKGYQRSDERIKELLCERLSEDPDIDPSDVTITVVGGTITLEGTVDSRQTKNAIEDVADQFGLQDVQNNLRVQRQGQGQTGTEGSGKSGSNMGKGTTGTSGNDDTGATKIKQH